MRQIIIFSLPLLLLGSHLRGAVIFTEKEKAIINTNALKVLEDYNIILNQIGETVITDVEKTKSNAESFLELFVNRQVLVYNDLDPSNKLSEFYEAETYTNNLILWYPDGMSVILDLTNARVSEITVYENNIFSLDILVKKTITGNFNNEVENRNTKELIFRIAFSMENKTPDRFRIVGIRNASSNYAIDYSRALNEVNNAKFTSEDILKVQSELKSTINDYTNLLLLIGDSKEPEEDKIHYKSSFLSLFRDSSIRVYNDIVPDPETNLISTGDYLNKIVNEYPDGINNLSIDTDSMRFGQVINGEDGSFYTYSRATKFFSGNYKGKTAFRKIFNLVFRISFNSAGKTYTGFRITGIDIAAVDFYEAELGASEIRRPELEIKPVTRRGFTLMITGSFGMTSINDRNIRSMSLTENSHNWNTSSNSGFITSLGLCYYQNNNLSFRSGVEFSKYSSTFNLEGKFTSSEIFTDANYQQFNKVIDADLDSLVTIDYLTFPVHVNYITGKPGKMGYYGESGFNVSIPFKARYNLKGDYIYTGFYPNAVPVLQNIDINELGFYRRDSIASSSEVKMKGVNLSIYASAGISIPLGYYSSITAGPEIIFGISDILRDKETYTDIFGRSYTHQPTRIRNIGFRISLNYKL